MSLSTLIRQMAAAGAPPEAIALAVEAIEAAEAKVEEKRTVERERKRRQRERAKDEDGTVTGQSRDEDGTVTDAPLSRPLSPQTPLTPTHTPGNTTRARKGAIPANWQPAPFGMGTESRKVTDAWPPGEMAAQVEQFLAHHSGKGSTFVDPQAAWSTWVLNSRKFGNVRQRSQLPRPTTRQLGERAAARLSGANDGAPDGLPRLGAPGGHG